jgi:hypothetical protein
MRVVRRVLRVFGVVFFANYVAMPLIYLWSSLGFYGVPSSDSVGLLDGIFAAVPWLVVGAAAGWLVVRSSDPGVESASTILLTATLCGQHLLQSGFWWRSELGVGVFPVGAAIMGGVGAVLGGVVTARLQRRDSVPSP